MRAVGGVDHVSARRTPTSRSCKSPQTPIPKPSQQRCASARTSSTRSRAIAITRWLRPNDPLYDRQWNFPAIDMERAWDIQPQAGSEIIVAVLDTGVAFQHADTALRTRDPCPAV